MKQKALYYTMPFVLALLPIMAIFIGEKTVAPILILLGLLLFFEKKKIQNLKVNKVVLVPFVIALIVFLLYTILAPDIHLALKVLERQISLIVIPFFALCLNWNSKRLGVFYQSFIFILLAIGVFSICYLLWFSIINADWISLAGNHNGSTLIYLQYKYPHIMGAHPTYWSYLLLSAVIMLLFKNDSIIYRRKYIIPVLLIFFNINMIVLAARMPLFINLLVHLLFAYQFIKKENRPFRSKLALIALIVTGVVMIFKSPLMSGKLSMISEDERHYNWPFAVKTIDQNFYILGEGLGQGHELIRKNIIENGDRRLRYMGYDLHNQYLRHYMDMGILGLLSLITLLAYPLYLIRKPQNVNKILYLSFFLFFSLALMTESYMYRLKGIVFFSVMTSIVCVQARRQLLERSVQLDT